MIRMSNGMSSHHVTGALLAATGAALLFGAPASAVQAEARDGRVLLASHSERDLHAARDATALTRGTLDPEDASVNATAAALRNQAARIYGEMERWDDVALYHAHAALLSGFEGRPAVSDLLLAGHQFWRAGERGLACASLRKAGQAALRAGDVRKADLAYRSAERTGVRDCLEGLGESLGERFVAPPAAVTVAAPELHVASVEEARIRPEFRAVAPPRPSVRTRVAGIPPAPSVVEVEPPVIRLPVIEEARIAPVLELPGEAAGTVSGRRGPR